jgi:outer membrane protein OmpA-like peptidoglycan-associated protein
MTANVNVTKKQSLAGASAAVGAAALILLLTTGCSTKNYVRSQAAPLIQNTNELDARTSADHRNIVDTDQRAQAGIASAQTAADAADQHAMAAGQSADKAQGTAKDAYNRVDSLAGVVANLDNYRSLSESSVTFGFDKATLTADDKKQLDAIAASLDTTKHYILELTGGTDSVGDAQYNYTLSNRRADAVAFYLQSKYNIAPHKFYMVGIGKDNAVASNKTAAGRKENRRVEVKVLSNLQEETTTAQNTTSGQQ